MKNRESLCHSFRQFWTWPSLLSCTCQNCCLEHAAWLNMLKWTCAIWHIHTYKKCISYSNIKKGERQFNLKRYHALMCTKHLSFQLTCDSSRDFKGHPLWQILTIHSVRWQICRTRVCSDIFQFKNQKLKIKNQKLKIKLNQIKSIITWLIIIIITIIHKYKHKIASVTTVTISAALTVKAEDWSSSFFLWKVKLIDHKWDGVVVKNRKASLGFGSVVKISIAQSKFITKWAPQKIIAYYDQQH